MRARLLPATAIAALVLAACGTEAEAPEEGLTTDPSPTASAPATDEPTDAGTDPATATPSAPATGGTEGGAGDTAAAAEPVVNAVDATLAEGSAAFEAAVSVDSPDLSDSVRSSGVADFEGGRRQIDVSTGAGDVTSIVSADGLLVSLGDGLGWLRADPNDLRGTPLEAFGLATIPLQDPSVNLSLLRGATEDVEEVGEEDIDGETTTHYRVTADLQRAAAQADADTRAAIEALGAEAGSTVDMEVWIDGEDRIRRVLQRTALDQTDIVSVEGDLQGTLEVSVDLSDFGTAVAIEEPGEGQVLDMDEQTLRQVIEQFAGGGLPALPGDG